MITNCLLCTNLMNNTMYHTNLNTFVMQLYTHKTTKFEFRTDNSNYKLVLSKPIVYFDKLIMDTIYTLYKMNLTTITPDYIFKFLIGDMKKKISNDHKKLIYDAIIKLSNIQLSIYDNNTLIENNYLINLQKIKIKTNNNYLVPGFKIKQLPYLYNYENVNKLTEFITIENNIKLLPLDYIKNIDIVNTIGGIVCKHYLIDMITYSINNNQNSCHINVNDTETNYGMFNIIFNSAKNVTNKSVNKNNCIDYVSKILTHLKNLNLIDSFKINYRTKKQINNIEIIYNKQQFKHWNKSIDDFKYYDDISQEWYYY